MSQLKELPLFTFSLVRSAIFLLEFKAMNFFLEAMPTTKKTVNGLNGDIEKLLRERTLQLLKNDAAHIASGHYPLSVLKPEAFSKHFCRLPLLALDGWRAFKQRGTGRTAVFSDGLQEELKTLPRYYRRNFHFQKDGYLSSDSAALYEHQVEILFGGAADAMRRSIIPYMKEQKPQPLKILEIAAGTGRASKFVKLAFPDAQLTVTDISDVYLSSAKKQLAGFRKTNFVCCDAAHLPFKDKSFDAVYSVFLFHELPLEERRRVIAEVRRVLKPSGFVGFVDSLQKGDVPAFDPLLATFPVNYHEPFYRNYSEHPMESLFEKAGFNQVGQEIAFVSKTLAYKG